MIVLADDIAKLPIKLFRIKWKHTTGSNKVSDIILNKVNDYMTSFVWKRLWLQGFALGETATTFYF
ncbi:hypothetical protein PO124_35230 [Bacillus licheniformis]|nr:hypothetical protein [Bacillus licheniformis]